MSLVGELIRNNRRQLQDIIRINHRVEGQCLVSNNTLKNRMLNFKSLSEYFKLKNANGLKEKSESLNMRTNRRAQASGYSAAQVRFKRKFANDIKKWNSRINVGHAAVVKVDTAIKAVQEWRPKGTHSFIEKYIQESVALYEKVSHYPLDFDYTFVELAANDTKVRRRLYQWLKMLKLSIVKVLSFNVSSKMEVTKYFNTLNDFMNSLIKLLGQDAKRLDHLIENLNRLINGYTSNEKIYSVLLQQTKLVIESNKDWCRIEVDNFKYNKNRMSEQLKVFIELKEWFRHHFSKVRAWIVKKFA